MLVDEPTDVTDLWPDDLVSFLIGCSFSFETALLEAGVPVRNIEQDRNVSMYRTNVETAARPGGCPGRWWSPCGRSRRPMVDRGAGDRPDAGGARGSRARRRPGVAGHRRPLARPTSATPSTLKPGDVPVFWACGVTPQAALMASKPPFAITHAPGFMFVTDVPDAVYRQP